MFILKKKSLELYAVEEENDNINSVNHVLNFDKY